MLLFKNVLKLHVFYSFLFLKFVFVPPVYNICTTDKTWMFCQGMFIDIGSNHSPLSFDLGHVPGWDRGSLRCDRAFTVCQDSGGFV